MARIIDYPRASLKNALELAEGVASLGGSCKAETAAEKTGRKISGAFHALVASAVRYGLITSKNGALATTPLFRSIQLAYSAEEKNKLLIEALLSPPLFKSLANRFNGLEIPAHFSKMLIREFSVPEDTAGRVDAYFVQGAKMTGLISADGKLRLNQLTEASVAADEEDISTHNENNSSVGGVNFPDAVNPSNIQNNQNVYSISFKGPGLNSTIVIGELDDLFIVEAMLAKVKKKLEVDL